MSLDAWYNWLMASSIVVLIGVILEGEELVSEFRKNGWMPVWSKVGFGVLVIGLAGEVFFQTKIESADAELKRQSDVKITTAQTETATANERAATLERDSAKLKADNLALEQQISPRRLKQEQIDELARVFEAHSSKDVALSSYAVDLEFALLGEQFMKASRWANSPLEDRRMSVSPVGSIMWGISVTGTDAEFRDALIKTLNLFGLQASNQAPPVSSGISLGGEGVPASAKIFIGVKPLSE